MGFFVRILLVQIVTGVIINTVDAATKNEKVQDGRLMKRKFYHNKVLYIDNTKQDHDMIIEESPETDYDRHRINEWHGIADYWKQFFSKTKSKYGRPNNRRPNRPNKKRPKIGRPNKTRPKIGRPNKKPAKPNEDDNGNRFFNSLVFYVP